MNTFLMAHGQRQMDTILVSTGREKVITQQTSCISVANGALCVEYSAKLLEYIKLISDTAQVCVQVCIQSTAVEDIAGAVEEFTTEFELHIEPFT